MVIAIKPGEVFEGIHPDDMEQPAELRTTWRWIAPTVASARAVKRQAGHQTKKGRVVSDSGEMERFHLKLHLLEPVNFLIEAPEFDQDGVQTKAGVPANWATESFHTALSAPKDETLNMIPASFRDWLYNQIQDSGTLTEEQSEKP